MQKNKLIQLLKETKAIQFGTFTLSSGQTSHYYVNSKLLTLTSSGLTLVSEMMADAMFSADSKIDCVGGPELGAVVLVGGVLTYYPDLRGFIVRKEPKGHGAMGVIDGPMEEPSSHVCVVEDVVTTGNSALRAVDLVESLGHKVTVVCSILDRQGTFGTVLAKKGIKYLPLLTEKDLHT